MEKVCFGVDIGGTSIKLGMFSGTELLEKWEIKTRTEDHGKNILEDVAASILAKIKEKNIAHKDVAGIGLDVPGPVKEDGTVIHCVNLGWGIFNVEKELSALTGFPVKAGNDANVAALGEMWKGGAAAGYSDVVMVTLGTGVGGGIIIKGEILAGENGAAGEFSHMTVNLEEEEQCNCGKKGCLEQYASGSGIAKVAQRKLAQTDKPSVLRGKVSVTARDVIDAAKENDALAVEVMETVGHYLGYALAAVSTVLDPEVFVIGGGVSRAGDYLLKLIEKYYVKYAFHASRKKTFVIARLGNDAGIYGCAKLIMG